MCDFWGADPHSIFGHVSLTRCSVRQVWIGFLVDDNVMQFLRRKQNMKKSREMKIAEICMTCDAEWRCDIVRTPVTLYAPFKLPVPPGILIARPIPAY